MGEREGGMMEDGLPQFLRRGCTPVAYIQTGASLATYRVVLAEETWLEHMTEPGQIIRQH